MSNLTISDQIKAYVEAAPEALRFRAGNDFATWKATFRTKFEELLGPSPEPVPISPRIVDDVRVPHRKGRPEHRLRKVLFDTETHASAMGYLYTPTGVERAGRGRTILVCHGHEPRRHALMGKFVGGPWRRPFMSHVEIPAYRLLQEGYNVFAPVWRGFKERNMDFASHGLFRDPCNVGFLAFGYRGYNLLRLNLFDASRSIDVLEHLDLADQRGIGLIGKSYGGTIGAMLSAQDERVKASVISGYLSTVKAALLKESGVNTCGSQFLPGLLEWGDIPDVFGLIAPKPLLIESGTSDQIFNIADARGAFQRLSEIYSAAHARHVLVHDVANVGHDYILQQAIPFFSKHLEK